MSNLKATPSLNSSKFFFLAPLWADREKGFFPFFQVLVFPDCFVPRPVQRYLPDTCRRLSPASASRPSRRSASARCSQTKELIGLRLIARSKVASASVLCPSPIRA